MVKENNNDFSVFVDLEGYILHTIHNAFGKGLENMVKII